MIGIMLSILILIITLFIACFINFYALTNLMLFSKNDNSLKLGLAAILSIATILVLISTDTLLLSCNPPDVLLFGSITGILFASIKIKRKALLNKDIKISKRFLLFGVLNYITYATAGMSAAFLFFFLIYKILLSPLKFSF